jgi:hypothetical protein
MRVLVCGGRDFDDWGLVEHHLDLLYEDSEDSYNPFVIIEGGATGADFLARVWGKYNQKGGLDVSILTFPADWKTYGKAAGAIRNQQMLDEGKPDIVVAFAGGRGTADMVSRAKKAGVRVLEIRKEVGDVE